MYSKILKPVLDFCISIMILVVLSPLIIALILVLAIVNNGKPFFFQERPGRNGEIFTILKFKTMNDRKDHLNRLLPDTERITKIGQLMRDTSLDEILQLINVLKGEMSLVGPRPLLIQYLDLYNNRQARRHDVRPGITGWAQVNGRNAISWEQKFEYDVWYVDNISLATDLIIVAKTFKKIVNKEGVSASKTETMEAFKGTENNASKKNPL
ncbi:Undecaprenyl phosphate N,N'-diacetylbacillosamine 1-phosphate transferase [Arenibacter antarcticus]|uniref:Sugar transferase n=1 Tax=Arenibacter antarcticus TaxID=2040469 RepID=A0ABW5VK25_9FLAO|nr:sugar transferase [Arenibacter sp. H213]MCM4167328.1 lipid carrier--UDP-N-acetylgalactosaminyltransferase [Arenibacter sp. H213]